MAPTAGLREGERPMEYQDRVLKCVECGEEFVFSAGEQLFYSDKGFRNEPKRCKSCKSSRSLSSKGESSARVTTSTVCSHCGKETTVPFKPTQGRPVYCRECFEQRRASAPSS